MPSLELNTEVPGLSSVVATLSDGKVFDSKISLVVPDVATEEALLSLEAIAPAEIPALASTAPPAVKEGSGVSVGWSAFLLHNGLEWEEGRSYVWPVRAEWLHSSGTQKKVRWYRSSTEGEVNTGSDTLIIASNNNYYIKADDYGKYIGITETAKNVHGSTVVKSQKILIEPHV